MNVECSSATLHLAHFVRDDRDLLNLEHLVQRRRSAGVITDARIRGRKGGRARKVNTLIACRRVVIPADQSGQILARVLRPSLLIEFKPFPGV